MYCCGRYIVLAKLGLQYGRCNFRTELVLPDIRFPCKSRQNQEPTSGLEPLTCSLRVRFEAFLGIAHTCKTRLDKLDSFPSFAYHCT